MISSIVSPVALFVVRYSVRILFTGITKFIQGVSGTVSRVGPASMIGRPSADVPLRQHKNPGCLTTIPTIATLRFYMKNWYRKDSFFTTVLRCQGFFLLLSICFLRAAWIQFSASFSLSFLSFSLNRLYFPLSQLVTSYT